MPKGEAPCVSVVMITYNHERYIAHALQSILDQSLRDFECIIVNDGSTDGTADAIAAFDDPRLIVINQENVGPSGALNTGIARATGTYVAIMSGDDICAPQRLERQVAHLTETGGKAVFSWITVIDDEGLSMGDDHVVARWNSQPPPVSRAETLRRFFLGGNFLCAPTAMLDRAIVVEAGGFCLPSLQTQDFILWSQLLKKISLDVLPERLVQYRVRLENVNLSLDAANTPRINFETHLDICRSPAARLKRSS